MQHDLRLNSAVINHEIEGLENNRPRNFAAVVVQPVQGTKVNERQTKGSAVVGSQGNAGILIRLRPRNASTEFCRANCE